MPTSSTISSDVLARSNDDVSRRPALAATAPLGDAHGPPAPSLEDLIAYHEGTLPAARRDRLQEALLHHPQSVATLLELDAFTQPPVATAETDPTALAGAALGRAVAQGEAHRTRAKALAVLAVTLGVVILGLATWIFMAADTEVAATPTLAAFTAPLPNAPIFELAPRGGLRGTAADGVTDAIAIAPPASGVYTLSLYLPTGHAVTLYQATLRADGATHWQGQLRPDDFGTVTLALPASFLAPGSYHIELAGLGTEPPQPDVPPQPVALYAFTID